MAVTMEDISLVFCRQHVMIQLRSKPKSATLVRANSGTIFLSCKLAPIKGHESTRRVMDADAIETDGYAYVLGRTCAGTDAVQWRIHRSGRSEPNRRDACKFVR